MTSPSHPGGSCRIIVITGASGGIGAALARRLGTEGHRLVLAARREDALRAVAAEAMAAGAGEVLVVVADMTVRADVERLRDEALARFGHVDAWVNNAGRGLTVPVLELTDAMLDDMVAVNVKSALYGIQAIVPHFQSRARGHVVVVSSFLARAPLAPLRSAYSAAKAMLNSLTTNLRMDLAATHPGIAVTTVMPGMVATDFARNAEGAGGPPPPAPGTPLNAAAMGVQTPEEVADVIATVLATPCAEVYTNPSSPETARRFLEDLGAFERVERAESPS